MSSTAPILIVEDNEDDLYFLRRSLRKVAPDETLAVVTDGQSALDYLNGVGPFKDRGVHPYPRLMFLDLKLPYVLGLDVLAAIRRQPALRALPVFVLTSSSEQSDRERAQQLGIQGYLVKPASADVVRAALASVPAVAEAGASRT